MSGDYCRHLLNHEPLVLFFAEAPALSSEQDELLVRGVLDRSIADHRAPWWELPPRGERPLNVIAKHCPRKVDGFLRAYLEADEEIARLWATACAKAWGDCSALNPLLNRYAHDPLQHGEIRTWAIEAIVKNGVSESIENICDLVNDKDDRIRGLVSQTYRQKHSPRPRGYIEKLLGGSSVKELLCILQVEVKEFGLSLDRSLLDEAFEAVEEYFVELDDLRHVILGGLFERAINQNFDAIPASLIVRLWSKYDPGRVHYERALSTLFKRKIILRNLVLHVLALLKFNESGLHYLGNPLIYWRPAATILSLM